MLEEVSDSYGGTEGSGEEGGNTNAGVDLAKSFERGRMLGLVRHASGVQLRRFSATI